MPENESLDFGDPGARRWDIVWQKVRNGEPRETIADVMTRRLYAALRKAFKELDEHGASFAVLLANRDRPQSLRQLVEKSKGHPYAELFRQVAAENGGIALETLLDDYLGAILERIEGQIVLRVVSGDRWQSIRKARAFLCEVRRQMHPQLQRIPRKFAENPAWKPRMSGRKGSKGDPTAEILSMSLLGAVGR